MSKGVIYLSRVFKCKTCGAELDFDDDNEIVQCPYCGTRQSLLPENEDEQRRKIDELDRDMIFSNYPSIEDFGLGGITDA